MKKKLFRLIALAVTLCLLVSGCSISDLFGPAGTSFEDMVYSRPNLTELTACADRCIELAEDGSDFQGLWSEITNFFNYYSSYSTQYLLAYVHYCQDLRDSYWVEEYNYCEDHTAQVDSARDRLLHALAKSPLRDQLEGEDYFGEGYFDDFDGESIWTEEFEALNEKESELIGRYYEIYQQSTEAAAYSQEYYDTYGLQMEELFVELVVLRQQLAQEAGYDSYPEYAYETLYYRDYSVSDASELCWQISLELAPLYLELAKSGFWDAGVYETSEQKTFQYVRTTATNMGGQIEDAFQLMSHHQLYDISYSEYKLNNAFEVYLYDYAEPYIFLSPSGTELDHMSFVHEFGHFCNDYVSFGSVAGIDTGEVFSQGMEYLSLFYGNPSADLAQKQLADGLCTYVEQAAYSYFEQQVYGLALEEITVDAVRSAFEDACELYGLAYWQMDTRSYVDVSHFFTQPLYVISYVVSNDAAFQLYQLEQQQSGAGLAIYNATLGTTQEEFLSYLEEAGLDSPFLDGRIQQVKETFQKTLLP